LRSCSVRPSGVFALGAPSSIFKTSIFKNDLQIDFEMRFCSA